MVLGGEWAISDLRTTDKKPFELANNGGKMERSRFRARTGMRYELLNPILEELAREGRIKMTVGKQGDLISLVERQFCKEDVSFC